MSIVAIIGSLGVVSAIVLAYQAACYAKYRQEEGRVIVGRVAHASL